MFGWEFPPHNAGGLGVASFGLSRALSRLGAKVTFVLPKPLAAQADYMKIRFADDNPNIKFRPVDSLLLPYISAEDYKRGFGGSLIEEVLRYSHLAGRIAREEPHDVIHAHDWLSFGAGLMARQISKKPMVAHVHATEYDRTGGAGGNPAIHQLEGEGLSQADQVVAVSYYTKKELMDRYGLAEEKITVVHNGYDSDQVMPIGECQTTEAIKKLKAQGFKIVIFVGRITLQKGPDYFVEVAKRVSEFERDVLFVLAGSGDMERQIVRQAAELGVADKVIFAGFLRGEELACLYSLADMLVMPSVSEPFGLTPLEAVAYGTPVLISKQSGVSEVLFHALKADFWDVDEMANKILTSLRHRSLPETLSRHSGEELSRLTWASAAEKCLGLYRHLIGSPALL